MSRVYFAQICTTLYSWLVKVAASEFENCRCVCVHVRVYVPICIFSSILWFFLFRSTVGLFLISQFLVVIHVDCLHAIRIFVWFVYSFAFAFNLCLSLATFCLTYLYFRVFWTMFAIFFIFCACCGNIMFNINISLMMLSLRFRD